MVRWYAVQIGNHHDGQCLTEGQCLIDMLADSPDKRTTSMGALCTPAKTRSQTTKLTIRQFENIPPVDINLGQFKLFIRSLVLAT